MAEHTDPAPTSEHSVTVWLEQLQAGDSAAAQQLWQRYVERLIRLASRKLGDLPRRVADEEDVVLSAFHDFLQGVEEGRFARLDDREDLWQVLVMLTERRAIGLRRQVQAEKRGGGQVRGESVLAGDCALSSAAPGIGQLPGCDPTPQFAAQVQEEFSRLYRLLEDDTLRRIAWEKLEGYTNVELAARLGLSLRAVERKLQLIRRQWSRERES
jgi:DNA-directed RNA polymerase specialized sigma24 family protein